MRDSACGLIIDSLFFPFLLFPFSFLLGDKRAYIDIVGRELEGQKGRVLLLKLVKSGVTLSTVQ